MGLQGRVFRHNEFVRRYAATIEGYFGCPESPYWFASNDGAAEDFTILTLLDRA